MMEHSLLAKHLNEIFTANSTCCFLVAPVAYGKTRLCKSLLQVSPSSWKRILYLAPLRALGEEVLIQWQNCGQDHWKIYNLMGEQKNDHWKNFTCEQITEIKIGISMIESMGKPDWMNYLQQTAIISSTLIIWDEWHLCLNWESFRPQLLEIFMELAAARCNFFCLTATLPSVFNQEILAGLMTNYPELYLVNIGNYQLKYLPAKIMYFPSLVFKKSFFIFWVKQYLRQKNSFKNRNAIIFVPMRRDVERWVNWCRQNKLKVIGCVGGGVPEFLIELKNLDKKDSTIIVATSVLGHGVNLPEIQDVFLLDSSLDLSMWVQMVGRGGRAGNPYTLWCQQLPNDKFYQKFKHGMMTILRLLAL